MSLFSNFRLKQKLKKASRFLMWDELVRRQVAGTFIIEENHKDFGPLRIWWTPDDLLTKYAHQFDEELDDLFQEPLIPAEPCFTEYLHPETGMAILIEIPKAELREASHKPNYQFKDFLTDHLPQANRIGIWQGYTPYL
jgi:hypothetical protein